MDSNSKVKVVLSGKTHIVRAGDLAVTYFDWYGSAGTITNERVRSLGVCDEGVEVFAVYLREQVALGAAYLAGKLN